MAAISALFRDSAKQKEAEEQRRCGGWSGSLMSQRLGLDGNRNIGVIPSPLPVVDEDLAEAVAAVLRRRME